MSDRTQVTFRPMLRTDRGFFSSNWLRSFRRADRVRHVEQQTYFYFHHKILERLVKRGSVIIACNRKEPDTLYGFACFEPLGRTCVLHYIFVKKSRRRLGIGRALLVEALHACDTEPSALVWTHRTRGIDGWLSRTVEATGRELALLYNPYLIDERLTQ